MKTTHQFIDQINELRITLHPIAELIQLRRAIELFDNMQVEAVKVELLKPDKCIFDLLGLPFEGSQLKEFSLPLLRERYQGAIEDSVMVRVLFIW